MPRLVRKHPLAIRWMHWVNFPVLAIMVWSGMLIYWANPVYGVRFGGRELIHFFPDGFYSLLSKLGLNLTYGLAKGLSWHFFFMWALLINGLLYVSYNIVSGEWREIIPRLSSVKGALLVVLHDLRLYRGDLPSQKFNDAQKFAYTSVTLLGAVAVLTGLAIYKPIQAGWLAGVLGGYETARFLHFWTMILFVLFFLVHVGQVIRAGWNNFRAMITGYEVASAEDMGA